MLMRGIGDNLVVYNFLRGFVSFLFLTAHIQYQLGQPLSSTIICYLFFPAYNKTIFYLYHLGC